MDVQQQAVKEYLIDGIPYRALAKKCNISRSTTTKWVLVYQGINNIPLSHKRISTTFNKKHWGSLPFQASNISFLLH